MTGFDQPLRQRRIRQTIRLCLLLTSAAFCFYPAAHAQAAPQVKRPTLTRAAMAQQVQAKLLELKLASGFPGVNAAIAFPDRKYQMISVGYSDVEAEKALTPTDRMLAGSIGKTYVAALIMQLVEAGQINLDDKIEKWFGKEAWFDRLPNARQITLRTLMNHSSGIPEHVLNKDFIKLLREQPDKTWKPEELLAFIFDREPLFAAGQGWSYADTNYILVGMIFERTTGQTVYESVARRLLAPLQLQNTIPSDRRVIPDLITGYVATNSPFGITGRTLIDGKFIINPQMEWTGGGFAATAEDLARWAKALYEAKVFKPTTLAQMLVAVPAKTGRGDKYGLGVQVRESQWGVSYGHGGWFPGYLSEVEYFPQYKTAIAVQFNTDDFSKLKRSPRAYIAEIAQIVLGSK
jgi:D-alanyl-D-alanine carboxypeptidase